jgi:hypothetical protein
VAQRGGRGEEGAGCTAEEMDVLRAERISASRDPGDVVLDCPCRRGRIGAAVARRVERERPARGGEQRQGAIVVARRQRRLVQQNHHRQIRGGIRRAVVDLAPGQVEIAAAQRRHGSALACQVLRGHSGLRSFTA